MVVVVVAGGGGGAPLTLVGGKVIPEATSAVWMGASSSWTASRAVSSIAGLASRNQNAIKASTAATAPATALPSHGGSNGSCSMAPGTNCGSFDSSISTRWNGHVLGSPRQKRGRGR